MESNNPKHLNYAGVDFDHWLTQHASIKEMSHEKRMEYFTWNLLMQYQDAHPPGLPNPADVIDKQINWLKNLIKELNKSNDAVRRSTIDKFEYAIEELEAIKIKLTTPIHKF